VCYALLSSPLYGSRKAGPAAEYRSWLTTKQSSLPRLQPARLLRKPQNPHDGLRLRTGILDIDEVLEKWAPFDPDGGWVADIFLFLPWSLADALRQLNGNNVAAILRAVAHLEFVAGCSAEAAHSTAVCPIAYVLRPLGTVIDQDPSSEPQRGLAQADLAAFAD
jgi:hypothetical protein